MAQRSIFPDDEPDPRAQLPILTPRPTSIFPDDDADTHLEQAMRQAKDTPPDAAARVLKLQIKTGLPAPVIERNLDEIERRSAAPDFDAATLRAQSPHLAAWLQEDAQQAAIAQDDLEQLGLLEWLVSAPGRAVKRGTAQIEFGRLRSESLFRELSADEHARLEALRGEMGAGGNLGVGDSWFRGAVTGAAEQLPILFGAALQGAQRGTPAAVAAAGGAALLGQAGPQVAFPEEVVTVPGAFGTALSYGMLAGGAEFGFRLEAGLAYDEYLEFEDELGQRIDPDVARAAALATGTVNAGLEAFGLERFVRLFPGANTLMGGLSRSAVKEALRSPTVRAALGQAAKAYAGNLTLETSVEMGQRAVTILSGEVAKAASGAEGEGAGDILADVANEGVHALQAFSLLSLPGPALSAGGDIRAARQAQHNQTFFTALGEGVANSKTAQRLPEGMQRFVERATKDGPLSHVYAPVDTWTTYWQSKNLDPARMAAELTGDATAYARAQQQGTDLVIPTGAYAAKLARTEHNTFFAQELRLGAELPNGREAKELETRIAAAAAAAAQAAPAEGEASPARDALLAQLEGAQFDPSEAATVASLHESIIGTVGARAGKSAEELVAEFPIDVTRPDLEGLGLEGGVAVGGIPASTAPAAETPDQRGARRAGQYAALTSTIVRDAVAQDPAVDVAALEEQVAFRLAMHEAGNEAVAESGQDPGDLLRAIAGYGGIWFNPRTGGERGEVEKYALESTDKKRRTSVQSKKSGRVFKRAVGPDTWAGVAGVFKEGGKSPDEMLTALRQEQRFEHLETMTDLFKAIDTALSPGAMQVDVNRFPGTDDLGQLGIRLGERWWEQTGRRRAAAADRVDVEERDAVDTGEGDPSFEFSQGPVDLVDESGRTLLQPGGFAGPPAGPGLAESPSTQRAREILENVRAFREAQRAAEAARKDKRAAETVLKQDQRGYIRFGKGRNRRFHIGLLRTADPSTILHELGHFYLELVGDLVDGLAAQDPTALSDTQKQLLADYGAILQFVGVENRAELQEAQHEQFARAFEAYLFEGKAPNVELRSAFARLAAWLKGVYRSMTKLDVEINDEVRAVFDRLVATDDAIEAARRETEVLPLFTDATSAGMTELEFASYVDEVREAHDREEEELRARVLSALKREEYAWWKREKEELTAVVTEELQQRPIYRAMSVMRTGAFPDGTSFVPGQEPVPNKLSRESLVANYGRDILKRLPRPYLYAKDSGISADAAAEIFEFSSGDELLKAAIAAPSFRQAVEREVDRRMLAKHGDIFAEGRLQEEAKRVVQGGEHRQKIVAAELKALTRGLARTTIPSAATINAAAQRQIAATRVRDLRPGLFLQASRRASRQAFELMAAGQDRAGAVRAKLQELINLALYREARDAKERVESMRQTLQGYRSTAARRRFGKAGAEYLAQIDALLARYELAHVTLKELEGRKSLQAFVAELEAEEVPVQIPRALLDESRRVNYQDVTMEELTGVYEAVEHIARLARLKNELLKAAKRRTFEEARDTLVGSIRLHNKAKPRPLEFRPADEKWETVGDFFAGMTKIAIHARALDGFEDGGEMWEQIIRPINEAADREQVMRSAAIEKIEALFRKAYRGRELLTLNHNTYIPAIGGSLSKEGRLMIALNWGNEDNRQRLLNDPNRRWNLAQMHAILETLDRRDWEFVQGVWDFVDSFWPEIEAKQKRVVGLAPEKVLASAVDTKYGQFRGGYFPIKADGRLVARASILEETGEATLKVGAAYVHAQTRRGHLEARADHVKTSVRLDFSVLFNHVEQVIKDLTHHEMLLDVSRLLNDEEVQAAILETRGHLVYRQFIKALEDITIGLKKAEGFGDKIATFLRHGTQIALLGLNFWTALQQPLGLFNGMQRVGVKWVLRGMRRWLRDAATMQHTVRWIHARSAFMKERAGSATQDLADLRATLSRPGGWFDGIVRTVTSDRVTQQNIINSLLWHIGQAQKIADVPTWLGAYEKAMEEFGDEPRAIALANQAVIDSQGSGRISDLSKEQRGRPIARAFLMFYTYGSTVFNQTVEAYGRTEPSLKRPGNAAAFLGHLSLTHLFPAVGLVTLSRLVGRTGGDDDDDPYAVEVAKEAFSAGLNGVVWFREASNFLTDGVRGYSGPAFTRLLQQAHMLKQQAEQGRLDEGLAKAALNVGGILFRFPAAQAQRTVDGFIALQEGRTRNPAALLVGGPRE